MRSVAVVTVGRSDYAIYLPVLRRIRADPELELSLIVAGMHLSPEFGLTVKLIEADGFEIDERVEMLVSSDTPDAIAKSMGLGIIGFAQTYARHRPDILVTLGDRFEMHAAALAALPFKIPVAHISGGEVTQGAIDDALRHSITKLSHLHFVSTEEYARRVIQLGEEPWRVAVSGSPSLDNARDVRLMSRTELNDRFGTSLGDEFLLVTYHAVTLEYESSEWQVIELLASLDQVALPVLFTSPNADTGGRVIGRLIAEAVRTRPSWELVENLGPEGYFSVMGQASAMVGNSSSGIVEASTFKLPVVNIGSRQKGRLRSRNIIDVGYRREEIVAGIREALSPEFVSVAARVESPYGDGHAAERIVSRLESVCLGDRLVTKRFVDHAITQEQAIVTADLPSATSAP